MDSGGFAFAFLLVLASPILLVLGALCVPAIIRMIGALAREFALPSPRADDDSRETPTNEDRGT